MVLKINFIHQSNPIKHFNKIPFTKQISIKIPLLKKLYNCPVLARIAALLSINRLDFEALRCTVGTGWLTRYSGSELCLTKPDRFRRTSMEWATDISPRRQQNAIPTAKIEEEDILQPKDIKTYLSRQTVFMMSEEDINTLSRKSINYLWNALVNNNNTSVHAFNQFLAFLTSEKRLTTKLNIFWL